MSAFEIKNIRLFILFRICFNARFYYPIFTILFLDYGLTLEQFGILNGVWAISIVVLEIPSGALADTLGRKKLLVFASFAMMFEMLLILFAPIESGWTFSFFLINRMISGAAEAAASGADEALAYDSIKQVGLADQWDRVLELTMRWKSFAYVIALSLGAVVYDAEFLNHCFSTLGFELELSSLFTLRIPIALTLLLSFGAIYSSCSMKEISDYKGYSSSNVQILNTSKMSTAWTKTIQAGSWILHTPIAFSVILAGLLMDHVVRLILTINSEFMRLISLPEATFGVIGAVMASMGILVPKLSRYLANNKSLVINYFIVASLVGFGLFGMSMFGKFWGILPMAFLYIAMGMTAFFVSFYLNKVTDSSERATVLSFRGLSYNLGYGFVGFSYSLLVYQIRKNTQGETLEKNIDDLVFIQSFQWIFPYYCLCFLFATLYCNYRLKKSSSPKKI
jgi:MFS family permease